MSSTTSTTSFHGTAITIRTHPESVTPSNSNEQINFMNINLSKRNLKLPKLPVSYAFVQTIPDINRKHVTVPQTLCPQRYRNNYQEAIETEHDWLNAVESDIQLDAITTEKVHNPRGRSYDIDDQSFYENCYENYKFLKPWSNGGNCM